MRARRQPDYQPQTRRPAGVHASDHPGCARGQAGDGQGAVSGLWLAATRSGARDALRCASRLTQEDRPVEPVRVKVYGLFSRTRRRYLIEAVTGAGFGLILFVAWWLGW